MPHPSTGVVTPAAERMYQLLGVIKITERAGVVVYIKSLLKAAPYCNIKTYKGADGIVSTLYTVSRPNLNELT